MAMNPAEWIFFVALFFFVGVMGGGALHLLGLPETTAYLSSYGALAGAMAIRLWVKKRKRESLGHGR